MLLPVPALVGRMIFHTDLQADDREPGRKQRPARVAASAVFAGHCHAQQAPDALLQEALRVGTCGFDPSDIRTVCPRGSPKGGHNAWSPNRPREVAMH